MKKHSQKEIFEKSFFSTKDKLKNFSKYVRRQDIARFMVLFELFKKQIDVKGSIVECGVHQGGGLMTWAKLSSVLEGDGDGGYHAKTPNYFFCRNGHPSELGHEKIRDLYFTHYTNHEFI